MKRRVTLTEIKKELTSIGQTISLDPIDKGERKFKREVRKILNPMKEKKKLEKFRVITTIAENDLLAEIYLSFPKLDEVSILELKISEKE